MTHLEYLKSNLYNELQNLNDEPDSDWHYFFSESDFEIVLNRAQKLGIGIHSIEPWLVDKDIEFEGFPDIKIVDDYNADPIDPKWYKKAFRELKSLKKNIRYAAGFYIPEKLLKNDKNIQNQIDVSPHN